MRTVTFKSVYESIARPLGMDPRGDAVSSDAGLSISDNLNDRVRTAWFAWEWPEWTITEERAFRQIWNSSRPFYQVGADGTPDEVFYIPNVATASLVDAAYYRVNAAAVTSPPIGTLPTDTTYWVPMDTVDTYVAYDQACRRRIGEVLEVFANNPAVVKPPRCLPHRPGENGIQINEVGGLSTVFVRYLIPAEQFTTFPYIPSRTYLRGDTVYVADQGECYQAIVTGTGHDPATEYSYWRRCLFPAVLAKYVQLGTYADCLSESDTSDEHDPVMLQIRGQNASKAASDAEEEFDRQCKRLQAQGQHYQYLPFGVRVARGGPAVSGFYSVPGYVLQGGGAYGYGPIAPTGSGTTTINDQCETAWGYIPPPPPEPGAGAGGEISGTTPLINGQGYIDVVFDTAERNSYWTFIECQVVNTLDPTPLNIWPGIVTSKTKTGFRLQLNGIPDSDHYSLSWTIKEPDGDTVESVTYLFSGPTSGPIGTPTGFTVMLPPGTVVPAPVTVTPSDGGAGGTFAPTSVELTNDIPTAIFTYTPSSYGAKSLSVTNDRGLEDPLPRTFTVSVDHYTLSGPTGGASGVPSTNFTVALPAGGAVAGTMVVTPSAGGGGGTFTPSTVNLTTGAPSATFTYTPASSGAKTISTTNNLGLTNPAGLTYTVVGLHLLNTLISYWKMDETSPGFPTVVPRLDSQPAANTLADSTWCLSGTGKINNGVAIVPSATQFMDCASNATLQVTSDFTFAFWIKFTAQTSCFILAKGDFSAPADYIIGYSTSTGIYAMKGTLALGSDLATDAAPIANGVWTHFVVWYDHVTGQIYIRKNDAVTFQSTTGTGPAVTTAHLRIGGDATNGWLNAIVDEVGFWKRVLSAAEITALYNGGAGLPYSSFTV